MQPSTPHRSILILYGSRLFWRVCETQRVTESTFTLAHVCDMIRDSGCSWRRWRAPPQTDRVHSTCSGPPAGQGSCLSFTEQSLQGSRLDPVCLSTVPCQGLCFRGWQLSAAGYAGALWLMTQSCWQCSLARIL